MDQSPTVRKIPLILVTGFLGSGKTSLLKQILTEIGSSRKLAIVQNEFAPGKSDSVELTSCGINFDLLEINNGSIFCACLMDDFIRQLGEFIQKYSPEAIFIEATGLADPVSMGQVMQAPEVNQYLFLGGIWTVIDCVNFSKSHRYIQRVRHQAQVADIILLNKSDLSAPDQEMIDLLKKWNPFAEFFSTKKGGFDGLRSTIMDSLDKPSLKTHEKAGSQLEESMPRPDIGSCVIRTQKVFTEQAIRQFHMENRGNLFRMKGFIKCRGNNYMLVQSIFDDLIIENTDIWSGPTEIILMGPGIKPGLITREFLKSGENG